ncbi:MAG: Lrp/AsnC ligand binding domain-containing protein [Sphingomonadales bacterium]
MAARHSYRELDQLDRRILSILQTEGRISNIELARRINLSATPCLERVRRLERDGFITGYAALVAPEKLDAGLIAFIEVSLDRTTADVFERFKAAVTATAEVQECHMVAGGFDYLLKVRVADMAAYRRFLGDRLAELPGVSQTHTYVVMEEVKATQAVPVPGV